MKRLCWHCDGALVAPGVYAEVEIEPGRTVKTHKNCAEDAKASVRRVTAAPPPAGQDIVSVLLRREDQGRQ